MPYALCPMPYALCPMPYAGSVPDLSKKGYIFRNQCYALVSYRENLKIYEFLFVTNQQKQFAE